MEATRLDLTTLPHILAKAEIVENPEGKEIKSRKVRSCLYTTNDNFRLILY